MIKRILIMTIVAVMAVGCGGSKKADKPAKPQDNITILCVNDFAELVRKQQARVIDVRTRTEYREGHIAGAENIDINQPDFVSRVNAQGPVAVYCRRGNRSAKAALLLAKEGVKVYDLGGGIEAWQQAGRPTTK